MFLFVMQKPLARFPGIGTCRVAVKCHGKISPTTCDKLNLTKWGREGFHTGNIYILAVEEGNCDLIYLIFPDFQKSHANFHRPVNDKNNKQVSETCKSKLSLMHVESSIFHEDENPRGASSPTVRGLSPFLTSFVGHCNLLYLH